MHHVAPYKRPLTPHGEHHRTCCPASCILRGSRRTARPGQQECPIRIWSCVLVMHRFPRDCILGGGRLGTPGGNCKSATYPHQPQESPPPPKGHKSPLHSPHKQNLHWRKVSFLSSASTLLLHCGASFFPSLFPSLSGSLSSPPPLRLPIAPQPSSATKLRDQAPRPCAETPGSPCGVSDVSTHNASKCNTQKHCLTHTTFECKSPRVENLVKNNAGNGPEAIYIYTHSSLTICMYTHLYIAI